MSLSAQNTSEQLKEIIQDEEDTDKRATKVQEQMENGEVLDLANNSSVLNSVLHTINTEFEQECLDYAVRLLNAHLIRQSPDEHVLDHMYSIPGLPGTKLDAPGLGHLVHREEIGFGCWYARSAGGGWDRSWKDFHLGCTGNALQIGDWESCNVVSTVHFMGEYPWRVGDFGAKQLSRHCRWRTGVVSAPEIEFCAPPPVGNPVNTIP